MTVAPEGQPVTTIKKVRFKLHSKLDALEKLGRYLGAWERGATVVQPPQITIQQYDFNKLSDDELQQLLAIKKKLMLHSSEAMMRHKQTSAFGEGSAQTMTAPASDSLKPPEQPFGKGPSTTVARGSLGHAPGEQIAHPATRAWFLVPSKLLFKPSETRRV